MDEHTPDLILGQSTLRRRLASIEAAAAAGIVCAIGWALSMRGLLSAPGIGAPTSDIESWYADRSNSTITVVWLQVLVFSTIAFLWFIGVIRGRVGEREPRLFGTVFLGASLLLAGALFVAASLLAAPAVLVTVGGVVPDPDAVSLTRAAAAVALSVIAPRIATLVMLSTASLGRATDALPSWLIWLTYLVAAFELVNVTIATPTFYLLPVWIATVSIVLFVRRPKDAFDLDRSQIWN